MKNASFSSPLHFSKFLNNLGVEFARFVPKNTCWRRLCEETRSEFLNLYEEYCMLKIDSSHNHDGNSPAGLMCLWIVG